MLKTSLKNHPQKCQEQKLKDYLKKREEHKLKLSEEQRIKKEALEKELERTESSTAVKETKKKMDRSSKLSKKKKWNLDGFLNLPIFRMKEIDLMEKNIFVFMIFFYLKNDFPLHSNISVINFAK